jgi:hypothetical protein
MGQAMDQISFEITDDLQNASIEHFERLELLNESE